MGVSRRDHLRTLGVVGGTFTTGLLGGCATTQPSTTDPPTIRVGSKPFPEQRILGFLAYERLQSLDDIQVVNEIGYGGSLENWNAVKSGEKDLYWEYTGTAWTELPPRHDRRVNDPDRLYELVRADAREQGIAMGSPAPFSNEWVLVTTPAWRDRNGVSTLSEFAAYVSAGHTDFGVAFNEDFYNRPDGWQAVADAYGIDPADQRALTRGTFFVTSVNLMYELLLDGRIQVASGFSTDPQLQADSFVVLEDDRDHFLPYQPAPTAYAPTIESHPEIFEVLEPVAASLDESTIRSLNQRVVIDDQSPQTVASTYLEQLEDTT